MEPLLDLIRLLRPRDTLFGGGLDGFGEWAVSFRKRDDLLFCWVDRGNCWVIRPGAAPLLIESGDFILIYTSSPFTLASDPLAKPIDSEAAVQATQNVWLKLGSGQDRPVRLHAGKFLVDSANEDWLADLVPPLVHVGAGEASLSRVHALLSMNHAEAREPGPASEFVIERLVELILVEILRNSRMQAGEGHRGLLAGLADKVTARAIAAIHRQVAHPWTVDELAKLCAVSRSTLASRFRTIVGVAPIEYLLRWRMALAKHHLMVGSKSVGEIAFAVGFQSPSAFTTAFTRAVGVSPSRFARNPTVV